MIKEMFSKYINKNKPKDFNYLLKSDSIKVEIGLGLINYANIITDTICEVRKNLTSSLGIPLEPIRIVDNMLNLGYMEYKIYINEKLVSSFSIDGKYLVFNIDERYKEEFERINGIKVKDPTFGNDAFWVDEDVVKTLSDIFVVINIDTVIDTVIATHITEIIKQNILELFNISMLDKLINNLNEKTKLCLLEQNNLANIYKKVLEILNEQGHIKHFTYIANRIIKES